MHFKNVWQRNDKLTCTVFHEMTLLCNVGFLLLQYHQILLSTFFKGGIALLACLQSHVLICTTVIAPCFKKDTLKIDKYYIILVRYITTTNESTRQSSRKNKKNPTTYHCNLQCSSFINKFGTEYLLQCWLILIEYEVNKGTL